MPRAWPRIATIAGVFVALGAPSAIAQQSGAAGADTRGPAMERLFISGHSLTDPPMPQHLASIVKGQGSMLQWNMQSIGGSTIRERTHGASPDQAYRRGTNRDGQNLDVLSEWRDPKTVQGGRYDGLLVAEFHGLLGALAGDGTIGSLRDIHKRFAEANPAGRTWLYEAWLDVSDKDDPSRWIAYERAAAPVWRCVIGRVNRELGASNSVQSVPGGLALAALVERGVRGEVAELRGSPRQVVEQLFSDNVHLTSSGSYYMAAVVYATLWGKSPEGAPAPAGVDARLASALQRESWRFVSSHRAQPAPMTVADCRDYLKNSFIDEHWRYQRQRWLAQHGWLKAYARSWWEIVSWHVRVRRGGSANPFAD